MGRPACIDCAGAEGCRNTGTGYRNIAGALAHHGGDPRAIVARMFDLLPVVRDGHYRHEFRGAFSIT